MPKQVQLRRGTTAAHATFTGALGELTCDTNTMTLRLHDGATAGGLPALTSLVTAFSTVTTLKASTVHTGQVVCAVLGRATLGDGEGGLYYWASVSTATDDGLAVVIPDDVDPGNPGRWLKFI